MSTPDIKKITKSLEEADNGFLLSFPPPPSGTIKPSDIYKYDFDVAYRLPLNPLSEVTFTPSLPGNTAKASYISSSVDSNINIGVSIKSIHKAETQTLLRLQIKDAYNNILYTDYLLIVCSPQQNFQLRGEILSRFSGSAESFGPNGGRILRINTDDTTGDVLSQLLTRMQVKGPGIPDDQIITIGSFIENNRSDIELLPFFQIDNEFNNNNSVRGQYSFSIVTSCSSEEDLKEIAFSQRFIILDKNNNWSFVYKDRPVIKLIRDTNNTDDNFALLFEIKNFDNFIGPNRAISIPSIGYLYGAGRVINDTICLDSI